MPKEIINIEDLYLKLYDFGDGPVPKRLIVGKEGSQLFLQVPVDNDAKGQEVMRIIRKWKEKE